MAGQSKARTTTPRVDPFTTLRRAALGRGDAQLLQALRDLVHIRRALPRAVTQLELLASPLQASATDGTGGHGGTPDPTPNGGEYARWALDGEEIAARLAEVCGGLTILRRLVDQVPTGFDAAAEAARARCTGGEPGTEGWERPECERNAVTRDGLCLACYQRQWRWARDQAEVQ